MVSCAYIQFQMHLGGLPKHSKMLKLHSASRRAALTHFFVLSNLPRASRTGYTHANYEPFLN